MQINYEKNGKYEKLYPKTISTNVEMLDGRNLNQWKEDFEDEFNVMDSGLKELQKESNDELWSGADILSASSTISPSKALNNTKNGYVLVFARRVNTVFDNYNYYHLPKTHLLATNNGVASGVKIMLGSASGDFAQKYLYIKPTSITGHNVNTSGVSADIHLVKIYEY